MQGAGIRRLCFVLGPASMQGDIAPSACDTKGGDYQDRRVAFEHCNSREKSALAAAEPLQNYCVLVIHSRQMYWQPRGRRPAQAIRPARRPPPSVRSPSLHLSTIRRRPFYPLPPLFILNSAPFFAIENLPSALDIHGGVKPKSPTHTWAGAISEFGRLPTRPRPARNLKVQWRRSRCKLGCTPVLSSHSSPRR